MFAINRQNSDYVINRKIANLCMFCFKSIFLEELSIILHIYMQNQLAYLFDKNCGNKKTNIMTKIYKLQRKIAIAYLDKNKRL